MFAPTASLSISANTWPSVPAPAVPNVSGDDFASAINSLVVLAGDDAGTDSALGSVASIVTAESSFTTPSFCIITALDARLALTTSAV